MPFTMKDAQKKNFSEMISKVNKPTPDKSELLVKNHVEKKKVKAKKDISIDEMNKKQLLSYAKKKEIKLTDDEKKLDKKELLGIIAEAIV